MESIGLKQKHLNITVTCIVIWHHYLGALEVDGQWWWKSMEIRSILIVIFKMMAYFRIQRHKKCCKYLLNVRYHVLVDTILSWIIHCSRPETLLKKLKHTFFQYLIVWSKLLNQRNFFWLSTSCFLLIWIALHSITKSLLV